MLKNAFQTIFRVANKQHKIAPFFRKMFIAQQKIFYANQTGLSLDFLFFFFVFFFNCFLAVSIIFCISLFQLTVSVVMSTTKMA
jgi:hypothetical protein